MTLQLRLADADLRDVTLARDPVVRRGKRVYTQKGSYSVAAAAILAVQRQAAAVIHSQHQGTPRLVLSPRATPTSASVCVCVGVSGFQLDDLLVRICRHC